MTTVQTLAAFMGIVLVILFVKSWWDDERKAVTG
jgi:hypothetical protein